MQDHWSCTTLQLVCEGQPCLRQIVLVKLAGSMESCIWSFGQSSITGVAEDIPWTVYKSGLTGAIALSEVGEFWSDAFTAQTAHYLPAHLIHLAVICGLVAPDAGARQEEDTWARSLRRVLTFSPYRLSLNARTVSVVSAKGAGPRSLLQQLSASMDRSDWWKQERTLCL